MSTPNEPDLERFLRDVENHKLNIILDEHEHRHIELKNPESSHMYFGIVTWPGHLAFYGDMGSFSFRRLRDMFDFFRGDIRDSIDFRYWAGKAQSVDCSAARGRDCDGIREFDQEAFQSCVMEQFESHCEQYDLSDADKDKLLNDPLGGVRERVLCHHDSMFQAVTAALEFDYYYESGEIDFYGRGNRSRRDVFPEFYEYGPSIRKFTYHFIWCCRALRWAINQYDVRCLNDATVAS